MFAVIRSQSTPTPAAVAGQHHTSATTTVDAWGLPINTSDATSTWQPEPLPETKADGHADAWGIIYTDSAAAVPTPDSGNAGPTAGTADTELPEPWWNRQLAHGDQAANNPGLAVWESNTWEQKQQDTSDWGDTANTNNSQQDTGGWGGDASSSETRRAVWRISFYL